MGMTNDTTFKKYTIDENNTIIGNLEVNVAILHSDNFIRPFIRKNLESEIVKFGNRDYQKLDQYVINSLNDYYNRLMSAPDSERLTMLKTYQRLYGMWQELRNFKISQDLNGIDKTYDLFSYELYVLGYNY